MLDIKQVRLIAALAEHRTVVRAGRVLGMSPSALTRAVMAIEERVGGPLFDRAYRGFEPTPVCRAIIAKAPELLARMDELTAIVEGLGTYRHDRIIIGAGPSALDTVVSPAIAMFLARQTAVQVQVLDGSAVDAARALIERRATLAIADVSDLDHADELVITRMRRHPFFVVARQGHPILSLGTGVSPTDIFGYPFIMPSYVPARTSPNITAAVAASKAARGDCPFPAVIVDNIGVSLAIAAQSNALVACTAQGVVTHIRSGKLVVLPWRPIWLETNFAVMQLRNGQTAKSMEILLECLLEADKASYQLALDLMPPGMAPMQENYAVVGRRSRPALTGANCDPA